MNWVQAASRGVIHWSGFDAANGTDEQKRANAKLTAIAPDLLELANLVMECGPHRSKPMRRQIEILQAKARVAFQPLT